MDTSELQTNIMRIRDYYREGLSQDIDWRKDQLQRLRVLLVDKEDEISTALKKDLHKSDFEIYSSEIGFTIAEIDHTLAHLDEWVQPSHVQLPLFMQPAKGWVKFEPLGLVLIMGAWNYPLQLTLCPLIAAIAAGNMAVIKPPRTAHATTQVLTRLLNQYLDPNAFLAIGDDTRNEDFLAQRWDKIFVTGSARIGKIVLEAAAKKLTPVTLELGGKSPVYVDSSANIEITARRIIQGKLFNAGQTCIAPDYVLACEDVVSGLVAEMAKAIEEFYGKNPQESQDYARIINEKQFNNLISFLDNGKIFAGGKYDRQDLYIEPTILTDVTPEAAVMQEEIFGPILPVLTVNSVDEAIISILGKEKPLAMYIFSQNEYITRRLLDNTSSGGVCINETIYHIASPELPFGGVGYSGMGKYHGIWGFRELSNARSILDHDLSFEPSLRYPPFSAQKFKSMKQLMEMNISGPPWFKKLADNIVRNIMKSFGNILIH